MIAHPFQPRGVLRRRAGSGATPGSNAAAARPGDWLADVARHRMLASACAGGAALLLAWAVARFDGTSGIGLLLLALSFGLCGSYAVAEAWSSLRRGRFDIHVLMVVGAVLAAAIGRPFEGGLLLFLFVLAGAMEDLATHRAERAVHDLSRRFPREAIVERDGRRQSVTIEAVVAGDRLIVRPSDRAACDGVVLEGDSHVDESAVTGEFLPRAKRPGDPVYAGSLNGEQTLVVRVSRRAAESTLARVVELVRRAREQKTRTEALVDRVGVIYGPAVFAAAILLCAVARAAWGESWSAATYRAITLLVVASPCALVLASPVAVLAAISRAASWGVVVKGGRHLDQLAAAGTLFVDKTGTLTTGRIRLAAIEPLSGDASARSNVLALAAALERDSTHPLAAAVLSAAGADRTSQPTAGTAPFPHANEADPPTVLDVRSHPGYGVCGVANGNEVRMGRPSWVRPGLPPELQRAADAILQREESAGRTTVLLSAGCNGEATANPGAAAHDGCLCGVLSFEDTPRPGAVDLARRMRSAGLRRVELLTGDRRGPAEALSRALGLDAAESELLPEQKLERVAAAVARGEGVVMLGDGVNDAPALARADVGVAMGAVGSDAALEAADLVLLHDRVELLPDLVRLARRMRRIVRQNVAFALAVIALLATWAAFSSDPLLSLGVVGHEGSTLIVVANSLRVLGPRVLDRERRESPRGAAPALSPT